MIKKNLFSGHSLFWLVTLSALVGLTLPVLIQDGMFMDAILYTSVSHNLGTDIGTFWFPQFSKLNVGELSSFHEQPPLIFGIQSLFFRLLGDSMYIERFYTFLVMCITAMLINILWKSIYRNNEQTRRMGWLPILLWITIPICFWSYSNNMHENTMGVFTLLAVLLTYNTLQSDKQGVVRMILPGIFIFLATFSKGLPGFFPITTPLIYWLTTKRIRFSKAILYTVFLLGIPLLIYAILICFTESRESLSMYFFKRALLRINEVPTTNNRFYTLISLFQDLLPQLSFTVIILTVALVKKIKLSQAGDKSLFLFFMGVGFAGSLPLMLTMVQKGFYYVPSLPFFAIGLAILISPVLLHYIEKINVEGRKYKTAVGCGLLLFLSVIAFSLFQTGKASRDKEMLEDVYLIKGIVPKYDSISVPDRIWNDWSLQCYLIRYCNINMVPGNETKFHLVEKNNRTDSLPGYKSVYIPTSHYDLFSRKTIEKKF